MVGVQTVEQGQELGINWYLIPKKGHLYLVKKVCLHGKCKQYWIGNVEVIEKVMLEKKQNGARPYKKQGLVRPPGFEPGIAGLGGRRPSPG